MNDTQNNPSSKFSHITPIKVHHGHGALVFGVIVLLLIFIYLFLYQGNFIFNKNSSNGLTDAQRQEIINQLQNSASQNPPLTDAERQNISNSLIISGNSSASLSDQERQNIIDSLKNQ